MWFSEQCRNRHIISARIRSPRSSPPAFRSQSFWLVSRHPGLSALFAPGTRADHPLQAWLEANGPGLHHFCLKVDDVGEAFGEMGAMGLPPGEERPHQGTQGKRALFLDTSETDGVLVELTGA